MRPLSHSRVVGPIPAVVVAVLALFVASVHGAEDRDATWHDLDAAGAPEIADDDPYVSLTEAQLADLALVIRIRRLAAGGSGEHDPQGINAATERSILRRFADAGLDADWLIGQRERVAALRRARAEAGQRTLDGTDVRLPGYVLPLDGRRGDGAAGALLVPWFGACVHEPSPSPSQVVHLPPSSALDDLPVFAAVWLEGRLVASPGFHELSLVDGRRRVEAAWAIRDWRIVRAGEEITAALADVPVPAPVSRGFFEELRHRSSMMLVGSMSGLHERSTTGLLLGLLVAFTYGVLHTLGPGHGKTVIASYFVGAGGSPTRGVVMAARIALLHVLSAIVLALLLDGLVRRVTGDAPGEIPAVRIACHAMLAVIGVGMLVAALRPGRRSASCGCGTCVSGADGKGAGWIAAAIGAVPCTGAMLVLFFGLANDLLVPALGMVAAMSLGMAIALAGVGVATLAGRRWAMERAARGGRGIERFERTLRVAGGALVLSIGTVLAIAAWQGSSSPEPLPVEAASSGSPVTHGSRMTPGT